MKTNIITPAVAGAVMGKGAQFVRIGLQRGLLPFGTAIKADGGKKHNYYISPKQFKDYTGATDEDIFRAQIDLGEVAE